MKKLTKWGKIQADVHTAAKAVIPKNSSPATSTPVSISTATKVGRCIKTDGNDIQTNIGQINFHLSNLSRNLMKISTSDQNPMTQKDMLRNVRSLGAMCAKLGAC